MLKRYLIAKIKTYEGNMERQQKKAKQYYARYKESNSDDDYRQSQYYYKEAEKSKEIFNKYKKMLDNGEYE